MRGWFRQDQPPLHSQLLFFGLRLAWRPSPGTALLLASCTPSTERQAGGIFPLQRQATRPRRPGGGSQPDGYGLHLGSNRHHTGRVPAVAARSIAAVQRQRSRHRQLRLATRRSVRGLGRECAGLRRNSKRVRYQAPRARGMERPAPPLEEPEGGAAPRSEEELLTRSRRSSSHGRALAPIPPTSGGQ